MDRIQELIITNQKFRYPKEFNIHDYYRDSFGIIIDDIIVAQRIRLKVMNNQAYYFRSLPLHSSQKEIETSPNRSVFSYFLVPNEDFYRELRACGRNVLVLSPEWLCQEFRADTKLLYNMYNEINPE